MSHNRWSGWVSFAAWLMLIIGSIDALEGLIAIVREHYYVVTPQQIIVFNVKEWGWITLAWGIVVAVVGLSLLSAATWARWAAIVIGSLSFVVQLGFLASTPYPVWSLTVLGLTVIVLYALTVRWDEATRPSEIVRDREMAGTGSTR
jgi:hypothetical protein